LVGAGAAFYHVYRALVGRDDGSVGEED
jgi:hypothetical protein